MKAHVKALVLSLSILFVSSFVHGARTEQKKVSGPKIDVLFVVDNSGTMGSSQQSFIANIPAFVDKMKNSDIDYHIRVATTDAYLALYNPNYANNIKLRDGAENNHSGVFVVRPNTPNLQNALAINLNQGISGSEDERAFYSFREVLKYPGNSSFRRTRGKNKS